MVKKSMAKKYTSSNTKVDKNLTDEQQFNSRLQECPIAIIGMASIFAEAKNLADYWDNIFDSVDAIKEVPSDRWAIDDYYHSDPKAEDKTYCKRGGFLPEIDFDPMEFGLPPNIVELTDIAQLLSLVVAREVLNDAGIGDGSGYDRDKVGITLGVGGGQKQISPLTARLQGPVLEKVLKASGVDAEDRAMIIEKFKKAYIGWQENSFPGMLGNVISGRIANRFDFGGTNCVVDAACAGSLAAIKLAISDLLEHRSEVMISGGVCCDNSPFMYMSFSKTPAFTTNEDIRPFDNDSKGMMIGEGIGMMAFKRLEDAERDGDKIYAVLKGIGTSSDGRFKSIYAPRPDGQAKALKRAYDDAGFAPKSCGLIEAHGTGTKAGDAAEFSGLLKHFSDDNDQKQHIALGSVKSQIGHTKAAAGAAGMIKAVLALHHKVLPATIHIDQPNSALDIENSPMYLNNETRPWMAREDGQPRRAGISSFGFGGTNYHMVLEEYRPTATGHYRLNTVPQTILVTASNEQKLVSALHDWQIKLSVDADAQPYAFNALVTANTLQTPAAKLARCGFVAKNATEALSMIDAALKQFTANAGNEMTSQAWSLPSGIYYRKTGLAAKGKVVALFSGQGSQYVNMGRELACNFPSVMQVAQDMDNEFTDAGLGQLTPTTYPIPVFSDDARKAQDQALRLTQHAQPAIGTLSVGLYQTFTNAGFKADFTAGHSFGELTALWAAGVLNDSDYMMLARSRGQAMAAPQSEEDDSVVDTGTMIAVVGSPTKVAEDIKDINDISIANYNANNQVVVAGVTSQIAIASKVLKAKGYKVVALPVSAAFHTPLVGHAQKPFAAAIDKATFNKPVIPVYSNGTAKAYANKPVDIKKSLKNHIVETVHFNAEIDNIYADGGRIFVEFGPKNILTKLVENILKDKDDVVAIAVNANPKKSADRQMRQVAVQMAVLGLELNEIDPYSAVNRPLVAAKMSPLAMKLTGTSYVSPKTKKAFDDALNDGRTVKQAHAAPTALPEPQIKVVEKIVEVERIVEVEKIVYLNTDGSVADASAVAAQSPSNHSNIVTSIERSVSQFVEHQQQLLKVHEQYLQGPKDYAATFDKVLAVQKEGQLSDSLDRTLGMYHDFQSETLRVHEQYLKNQAESLAAMLPSADIPLVAPSVVTKTVVAKARVSTPETGVPTAAHFSVPTSATAVASGSMINTDIAVAASDASMFLQTIESVMMTVVAEKTGYPVEMLELGMDMEADLGIDSIKRVEILGAVQETLPSLPELNPEDLAELRTLGDIVCYMQSKLPPTEPSPPGAESAIPLAGKKSEVETSFAGAPSATVQLTALSSVNKIVQDLSQSGANALIVDDGSGTAVALSHQLLEAGWKVTALKPNWVVAVTKKTFAKAVNVIAVGSTDNTIDEAQIKNIIDQAEQFDAVLYLQAANTIEGITYPEAAKQGLLLAFVLAKHAKVKLATKARASFVVVTRQGGALGFANDEVGAKVKAEVQTDLVQAGLAGLVKTLSHEWNGASSPDNNKVFCRVIDLSKTLAADEAATIINDELLDIDTVTIEVAHDTDNLSNHLGPRLTLTGLATNSYTLTAGNTIDHHSVFLVSGGAKGVTAHCVIEIAKQYQSKFILLGRSSFADNEPSWAQGMSDEVVLKKAAMQALIASGEKPTPMKISGFVGPVLANREIQQTLNAIKAAGGQAHYLAVDVTNSASVSAAVIPLTKELGAVTGIIHGAGVLADQLIEQKTLAEFNAVYRTKIQGLASLLAATTADNINHLVLFSSAAGFYGNPGQSDYAIANDILNKTAYRFKALNPSAQVLSFNWGPWDGGMVTSALKRMFNERGVYIIGLDAGAKLLVSELAADNNRCAQILVGNDLAKDKSKDQAGAHPVKKAVVNRLNVSVSKTLDAADNGFLADHTIGDDQVLPTVCAIAWMKDAAQAAFEGFTYQGLANYKLFKGVIFDSQRGVSGATDYLIEMTAEQVGNNLIVDTKISSVNDQAQQVFHYGAQLTLVSEPEPIPKASLKINRAVTGESAAQLYTNGTLFHGPSLQGITGIVECNDQGLLLSCQVPEVANIKQGQFPIGASNIFANDIAYQAMLVWVKKQLGLGSLPSSTQKWTVYREVAAGERFYLRLKVVKSSGKGKQRGSLNADIEFISENDEVLSELRSAKVTASANLNELFLPKVRPQVTPQAIPSIKVSGAMA
jgi:acyl transferase domain-containing protein